MKTSILCGLMALLVLSGSCLKDNICRNKSVESEDGAMQSLAASLSMTATKHSSGLYYQVTNAGSGATPTGSSKISVRYVGKLSNGTVFDQQTTATALYPLNGYIAGWQAGIPLIKKGGSIKLIIPSALAYGCTQQGTIPANSILYFEVELVDVQ